MKQVLIAEDNDDLRQIYCHVFKAQAFHVDTAADGKQTIEHLEKQTPDVIVLDLNMPQVSGFDVLDYLRDKPQFDDTAVIVVSGNYLADATPEVRRADRFLVKPISVFDVVKMAKYLLKTI